MPSRVSQKTRTRNTKFLKRKPHRTFCQRKLTIIRLTQLRSRLLKNSHKPRKTTSDEMLFQLSQRRRHERATVHHRLVSCRQRSCRLTIKSSAIVKKRELNSWVFHFKHKPQINFHDRTINSLKPRNQSWELLTPIRTSKHSSTSFNAERQQRTRITISRGTSRRKKVKELQHPNKDVKTLCQLSTSNRQGSLSRPWPQRDRSRISIRNHRRHEELCRQHQGNFPLSDQFRSSQHEPPQEPQQREDQQRLAPLKLQHSIRSNKSTSHRMFSTGINKIIRLTDLHLWPHLRDRLSIRTRFRRRSLQFTSQPEICFHLLTPQETTKMAQLRAPRFTLNGRSPTLVCSRQGSTMKPMMPNLNDRF